MIEEPECPSVFPCLRADVAFRLEQDPSRIEISIAGMPWAFFDCDETARELLIDLVPLLDGSTPIEAVCASAVAKGYRDHDARVMVKELFGRGLLHDMGLPGEPHRIDEYSSQLRWYGMLRSNPSVLQGNLSCARAAVIFHKLTGMEKAVSLALAHAGIGNILLLGPHDDMQTRQHIPDKDAKNRLGKLMANLRHHTSAAIDVVTPNSWPSRDWHFACKNSDFAVVLTSAVSPANTFLSEINRFLVDSRLPNILLRAAASVIELGPLVLPMETCCYQPLLKGRTGMMVESMTLGRITRPDYPALPVTIVAGAANIAAAVVADYIALGRSSTLANQVWGVDWSILRPWTYRLLKDPRCPACSRLNELPEGRAVDD